MKNKKLQALIGAIKNIYTIIQSKLRLLTCWQQAVEKTDCVEDVCCDCKKKNISCYDKKLNNMTGESNAGRDTRNFINLTKDFFDKRKLLDYVSEMYDINVTDTSKVLLLFENNKQRTFLIKYETEFLIINDNKGDIKLSLRNKWEKLIYIIEETKEYYVMIFQYFKPPLKISKKLFADREIINEKINRL